MLSRKSMQIAPSAPMQGAPDNLVTVSPFQQNPPGGVGRDKYQVQKLIVQEPGKATAIPYISCRVKAKFVAYLDIVMSTIEMLVMAWIVIETMIVDGLAGWYIELGAGFMMLLISFELGLTTRLLSATDQSFLKPEGPQCARDWRCYSTFLVLIEIFVVGSAYSLHPISTLALLLLFWVLIRIALIIVVTYFIEEMESGTIIPMTMNTGMPEVNVSNIPPSAPMQFPSSSNNPYVQQSQGMAPR